MIEQPFRIGQSFTSGRMEYLVTEGRNCPGDMILKFRYHDAGWHVPTIGHSIICVAFKAQVEDNNYPPALGYQGRDKLLYAIARGIGGDVQGAIEEIAKERHGKAF